MTHKKIGLALGSGGARGWAHIGVIQALLEAEIKIDYVAGTSIGAFVGAFYAAGGLRQLEEFVRSLDWRTIVSLLDLEFPDKGLLDGGKVYELLQEHLLSMQLEETEVPFHCVATDLLNQQSVTFKSGSLVDAVRASISIPGVFTPFEKDGVYYIDGGVINPVPVDVVKEMGCDLAIAVNLNHQYPQCPDGGNANTSVLSESASTASDRESSLEQPEFPEQPQPTDENDTNQPDPQSSQPDSQAKDADQATQDRDFIVTMRSQYESVQTSLSQKINNWLPERKQESPEAKNNQCPNIFDVIGNAINMMEQQVTEVKLAALPPDILIQPNLSQYGIFDFHCAEEIIQVGYEQTKSQLAEIEKMLAADED
ncbi:Patatin [Thalassoporum mexicanum PCC 7367]|uniref:patatin-like phospholipase family protein n=1 Tax=Thalassoporum mexicanum TaxID=3457544 RepID=UPI00029FA8DC|nr:patatin-like phospholipase family protein [Pseudanabaena sp. PCC 7367]AFY69333.1 Patatin [Pseudanabaena sp. PCC 7367]